MIYLFICDFDMLTLMNSESLATRVHCLRLPPAIMGRWMVGTICWSSRSLWFRLGSQPGCCRSQMDTCQEVVDWPLLLQTNFQDPSSYCWYVLSLVRWCLLLVRVYQQSCTFTHLGSGFKTQAHSCREAGCLRMFANAQKELPLLPKDLHQTFWIWEADVVNVVVYVVLFVHCFYIH